MDPAKTAETICEQSGRDRRNQDGALSKPGWTAIDRAVEAGRRAGVPVMVDDKIFTNSGRTTREELLEHLRPGRHSHAHVQRPADRADRSFHGKVQPWMVEARRRGVLFDVGHGGGSFLWPVAARAVAQGFVPDTISTDLHKASLSIQQSDMPNVHVEDDAAGDELARCGGAVDRESREGDRAIPGAGDAGRGQTADIAVLEEQTGVFAFKDAWPAKRLGTKRLECVLTVRDGKVVYQRTSAPPSARPTRRSTTS